MNRLIDASRALPTPDPQRTVAYTPITLPMEGRQQLELRLTAPVEGENLPVVILSHGFGPSNYISSKDGYAPLAQFWAERGMVVIQPTHASSRVAGLDPDLPAGPFFWRERVTELRAILDQLTEVERQSPAVSGRFDHDLIAVAGIPSAASPVACCLVRAYTTRIFSTRASKWVFYSPRPVGVALT